MLNQKITTLETALMMEGARSVFADIRDVAETAKRSSNAVDMSAIANIISSTSELMGEKLDNFTYDFVADCGFSFPLRTSDNFKHNRHITSSTPLLGKKHTATSMCPYCKGETHPTFLVLDIFTEESLAENLGRHKDVCSHCGKEYEYTVLISAFPHKIKRKRLSAEATNVAPCLTDTPNVEPSASNVPADKDVPSESFTADDFDAILEGVGWVPGIGLREYHLYLAMYELLKRLGVGIDDARQKLDALFDDITAFERAIRVKPMV